MSLPNRFWKAASRKISRFKHTFTVRKSHENHNHHIYSQQSDFGNFVFCLQANGPQTAGHDISSRAVATALGASDQSVLLQRNERTKPSFANNDERDPEENRLFNYCN